MELLNILNPKQNPTLSWVTILAILALLTHLKKKYMSKKLNLKNKVAFITGGSEGSGFEVAKYFLQHGGRVTIVSRSQQKLEKAKQELEKIVKSQNETQNRIFIFSADVSNFESVQNALAYSKEQHKTIPDYIIMAAGLARPGYFINQDIQVSKDLMEVNYFGSLNTAKAALPQMIAEEKPGKLVFFSSAVAICGMIGYSQYSPTKFALRGLTDGLQSELKPYGIDVHLFLPSNIDTPGFKIENKTKPIETQEIEGQAQLYSPQEVTQCLFEGIRKGEYTITNESLIEVGRIITDGPE
ncbi:hypothetical protein PPERSA_10221 [Pseudocohnilembus persalinus]|uniref:3-dehydrosphinganine reductase n=1 Tax=Pseudocohnilembus persalinus TaxID=266149 RepID=A0A0V0QLP6_PSEPJ|nr:hypothetical protein PPERSA_10221 [Pseudocohnilembus persalinus]|eukprot:KRX03140.1 hypothetical protein PPERSA_10221 [Pseudocohnilembus persalinus]